MDREARDQYQVVLEVKDMLGQSGAHSASTTVTVHLTDVNDNGPTFQHRESQDYHRDPETLTVTMATIKH